MTVPSSFLSSPAKAGAQDHGRWHVGLWAPAFAGELRIFDMSEHQA